MGILKIYAGKSKPAKKKPGWQKAEAEHAAWLTRMNSTTLFNPSAKPKMQKTTKKIDPVVRAPVINPDRLCKLPSLGSFGGAGTKRVPRPDIEYKHDPQMLQRELKARSVKHNAAPAYNKGAAQFVTEEELSNQLRGNKRRP